MSLNTETRESKALRLSSLYGYGAASDLVQRRAASRYRPTTTNTHYSLGLGKKNRDDKRNLKSVSELILERAQTAAVGHSKRWNFGAKLPDDVLHPVPPALVEDTTVVMRNAPYTWRSSALEKRINPLGDKSPYSKEALLSRPMSTHTWSITRKPHNFDASKVQKHATDEFLERVFYGETRADIEKQKRLRELKEKFEKNDSKQGRHAGLYEKISAPAPNILKSKAERTKPFKIWNHFTVMLKPKIDSSSRDGALSGRDATQKSIWRWHEARHFLGKIRRAQRPRAGMDNIQILLAQFRAGMKEHGLESASWIVNRDIFAKIILSKYSELEPRSANRLYSSLDLKYTDQVDFRKVVACLIIVQFRQSPAMTVLARLFDIFAGLHVRGGKTVPIDDICLILTACCPDTKSEVFLWETAQVGLRSQHPENHSYSFDDLREFLDREPKMYNTFCAFFDKVKRELLNRNPNAY